MERYRDNGRGITDAERAAFKKALTIYYLGGGPIADVFAQVEPGLIDRYYRRKKKHPDEMAEINREAQDEARGERYFERDGFDARQQRLSWEMEQHSGETLLEHLPELIRIIRGEVRVVEARDEDGGIMYKTIIPYPRDQIAAFKVLIDLARNGILAQGHWAKISSTVEAKADAHEGGLMPIFGANTAFKRLEGTAPDGTKISMSLDDYKDAVTESDDGADGDSVSP